MRRPKKLSNFHRLCIIFKSKLDNLNKRIQEHHNNEDTMHEVEAELLMVRSDLIEGGELATSWQETASLYWLRLYAQDLICIIDRILGPA